MSMLWDAPEREDDPLRLRVVMDDWTRPEAGTMEIDPVAGTIRIWLRKGEFVIPRGALTAEAMTQVIIAAQDGVLDEIVRRKHPDDRPAGIAIRDGNSFQVAAGAVTASLA